MGKVLNSHEALKILKDCYITASVQSLRKWIREGKIIATGSPYRQEGYSIKEEDLKVFIEEERPGLLDILTVYYEVIDGKKGVSAIVKQQEEKVANEGEEKNPVPMEQNQPDTFLNQLHELQHQIVVLRNQVQLLHEQVDQKYVEVEQRIINKIEENISKIENVTPHMDKDGPHSVKSVRDFTTLFGKLWEPTSIPLDKELKKKFRVMAKECYTLFYNENGHFKDKELESQDGYKLEIENKTIKGIKRKEIMEDYFKTIFAPKFKGIIKNEGDIGETLTEGLTTSQLEERHTEESNHNEYSESIDLTKLKEEI